MTTITDDGSTVQVTLEGADLDRFLARLSEIPEVQTEPRPNRDCCAACRRGEYLAEIRIQGYGKRVVCPIHAVDLIEREVSP